MISRSILVLVALVGFVAPASASDDWAREKGNCEAIFQQSADVVLQQLKVCVGRWMAYVDPNLLKPPQRQSLKGTFQDLYDRSMRAGDEEGEGLAVAAADYLGARLRMKVRTVSPSARRGSPASAARTTSTPAGEAEPVTASRREKFVAPTVSERDQRRAAKLVGKGVKYFRRGKRDRAKKAYEDALAIDPGNLDGIYNLAAELAFRKDGEGSVAQLQKLQDIGSKPALKRLSQSRLDPDFVPIHDYVPYKRVSGYARIKVVNSIGEFGEDEVERIRKTLHELKHEDVDVGVDKVSGRTAPVIWFKDHSAPTAYLVKKVVVHPGTQLTKINWNTDYDIFVSWGNKIVSKDGVKQPARDYTELDPDKQERRLDDLRNEEDKILRKPERAARKVEHTIETPDRVERKVKGGVDRVDKTVKTLEKTGKKIEGIFK